MRNIYKTLTGLTCIFTLLACSDLMDTHKEFIEGGEIIYAPKPDTIYFKAGKNRVQLNYEISKAPNIKEIEVSWNKGEDTKTFPLEVENGASTGALYIENLAEHAYTFEVRLVDNFGHSSLKISGFGRSYGDIYQSSLQLRTVDALKATDEGGIIEWMPASSGLLYNEVKYINNQGEEKTIQSDADDSQLILPDFQSGKGVQYRSVYIPEENCVDAFYTEWRNSEEDGLIFPHIYSCTEEGIDRSQWNILLCESVQEGDGQGVPGILDGDRNTFWHSGYDNNRVDCPYAIIFDMKESLWIGKIGLMQRNGGYNYRLTGVDFYVSDDEAYARNKEDNHWTLLLRTNPQRSDDMQWFDIPEAMMEAKVKGHLLKMVISRTYDNNGIAAMAEMAVQRITAVDGAPVQ